MKFNFKKLTIAIIILTIITFTGLKITKMLLLGKNKNMTC